MSYTYEGKKYRSKKHPALEHIFSRATSSGERKLKERIAFTLGDISRAYAACGIDEPASISNTILDLTRQDRGIEARLPESIFQLGYDLRKKTGPAPNGESYAGEFVYVGVGNALRSWLVWPKQADEEVLVENCVPKCIVDLISNDEGALFSVIWTSVHCSNYMQLAMRISMILPDSVFT